MAERGQTITVVIAPECTTDYKIGYANGIGGKPLVSPGEPNYVAGWAAGYARLAAVSARGQGNA